MTQKAIIKMATNDEIMYMMEKISHIQSNLCYKTEYEKKNALREMKDYVKAIQEILSEE